MELYLTAGAKAIRLLEADETNGTRLTGEQIRCWKKVVEDDEAFRVLLTLDPVAIRTIRKAHGNKPQRFLLVLGGDIGRHQL